MFDPSLLVRNGNLTNKGDLTTRKLGIDPAKMEHVIKKMYLTFSGQMYNDLCNSNTERNLQIAGRVDLKLLFLCVAFYHRSACGFSTWWSTGGWPSSQRDRPWPLSFRDVQRWFYTTCMYMSMCLVYISQKHQKRPLVISLIRAQSFKIPSCHVGISVTTSTNIMFLGIESCLEPTILSKRRIHPVPA